MLFNLFLRKEYTTRVFELVCGYVDLGFFACNSAIAIGMMPLLLQSLLKIEYLPHVVFCFAKIVRYDVGQLAPVICHSVPTLLNELHHTDNDNKTACILFIISRISADQNAFHHTEVRALDERIIFLL